MICGTLTLRYLFRIVLSGAVAKGEDFITSGSVTRQGGYEYHSGTDRRTWTFPITFPHACLTAMNTLMYDGASGDGNNDTVYNLSRASLNYRSDNRCGSYRIAIGY